MPSDELDEWYRTFYEETKDAPSVLENEIMDIEILVFMGLIAVTIVGIVVLIGDYLYF